MLNRRTLFATAALAACVQAHAASFECSKASTRVEKSICTKPALSELDAEIAAAYSAAGAGLDEEMRARLKRSQREWLSHRHPGDRLAENMRARLALLRATRKVIGGIAFLDLAAHSSRPMFLLGAGPGAEAYNRWADSVWDSAAGELTLEEGDLEQAKCEAEAKKSTAAPGEECVIEGAAHVFETRVPAPGIVSVQDSLSLDEHAAHPMNETHHVTWWLARGKRIDVADMFANDGWKSAIARVVRHDAESAGGSAGQDAIDSVSDPDAWWLTTEGLRLEGDGYTFERGRGLVEIVVPWHELRASLRQDFAAALGLR